MTVVVAMRPALLEFRLPFDGILEKLIVPHQVNKFPTFYEIQQFITVFTTAHHLPQS